MNQDIMNQVWSNALRPHDRKIHISTEFSQLLHTRYHVVPKLELTTGATAGFTLDDTKW